MTKYFVRYGCYLQQEAEVLDVETWEEANDYAYYAALDITNGWVGCQGFCEFSEEDELFSEGMTSEEADRAMSELIDQEVENALEYTVEIYDPEKHDGYLF